MSGSGRSSRPVPPPSRQLLLLAPGLFHHRVHIDLLQALAEKLHRLLTVRAPAEADVQGFLIEQMWIHLQLAANRMQLRVVKNQIFEDPRIDDGQRETTAREYLQIQFVAARSVAALHPLRHAR